MSTELHPKYFWYCVVFYTMAILWLKDSESTAALINSVSSDNDYRELAEKNNIRIIYTKTHQIVSNPPGLNTILHHWYWPTDGKIIASCNKGVDIYGYRGQPILAPASGRVVYAGNALRGYGNLIIIKHNQDYLTAYAHNETILVREQQEVKKGQTIATMGSTGIDSVRLHFEIRYKGQSVNPLNYLSHRLK